MSIGHSPDEPNWAPDMRKDSAQITEADKKDAKRRIRGGLTPDESPDASGDEKSQAAPSINALIS